MAVARSRIYDLMKVSIDNMPYFYSSWLLTLADPMQDLLDDLQPRGASDRQQNPSTTLARSCTCCILSKESGYYEGPEKGLPRA